MSRHSALTIRRPQSAAPARRRAAGALFIAACCYALSFKTHRVHGVVASFALARQAVPPSAPERIKNPVKTVSDSLADFYKAYAQPPLLPMYRPMLVDLLTQTHLTMFDSRFKYDAVFALGMVEYFNGLMGTYDKLVNSEQSKNIWAALAGSVGLDPVKVTEDAEAIVAYAKSTPPADILKHMEGTEKPAEEKAALAFESIGKALYSLSFSVGLFKMMELSGVEVNKANVAEWAKALKITESKVTSDLETYRLGQDKLKKAEEMLREVEIREKKKLAERLEKKAKALAAKAAGASANAKESS
eukprot:CAMPEP_0117537128 /NCGR_PEP_ID=MMETSP0784-20121206/41806_1 /TAXON_ID=39447 /ORGANISM="" /LENGTH=301 /DNA_ID=CAMNT_0005333707 /DNA_START=111 /DNA_END=1016 /DNA_ORIENTATION=+